MSRNSPKTLADLRVPAAMVIGLIWVVAFVVGVVTNSYVAMAATTPVLTIVAMAIFSIKNGKNGNGHPPS